MKHLRRRSNTAAESDCHLLRSRNFKWAQTSVLITTKTICVVVLLLEFFLASTALCQTEFNEFVPLKSTLQEVQDRLEDKGERTSPRVVLFELTSGNLLIYLSAGPCEDSPDGMWNVKDNVVVKIISYPRADGKKPKHYGLDPKSFEYQGLARGHKYFKNEEKGLFFTTRKGRVSSIHKYPSKDQQDLNCERNIGAEN